jgi:hypothetical protein
VFPPKTQQHLPVVGCPKGSAPSGLVSNGESYSLPKSDAEATEDRLAAAIDALHQQDFGAVRR